MSSDRRFDVDHPIEHVPTRDGYDRWAEFYDVDDNPLVAIEEPVVRRLLGNVRDQNVLDVCGGNGRHSAVLADVCICVAAINFAEAMMAHARAKSAGLNVDIRLHDLAQPLPFADCTIDRILCGLVIDHIANLELLFRAMGRVCRNDGVIVASAVHPAMMLKGVQARFRDSANGRELRPASCPHQISEYVMAAARAGLEFDHVGEHAVDEEFAETYERARK